ncbi:MAG TPA: hypothetical protein VKW06_16625 [Candidatus Angelobacter sp.]|nr:hypothetical protein [Candidatus Angelobacter sp.]
MKILLMVAIAGAVLCLQGCTRNDRDSAGLKHEPGVPPTEAQVEPPASAGHNAQQTDPAANGGMSTRAAAPYSSSGAAVSQNVNPGPFVTAASSQAGTAGAIPSTGMLTRSADGTMSGPNDLPAATTGWGTTAANYSGSADANLAISKKVKTSTPKSK